MALFTIVMLAAIWYCFSSLYHADHTRAGTLVQVQGEMQELPA